MSLILKAFFAVIAILFINAGAGGGAALARAGDSPRAASASAGETPPAASGELSYKADITGVENAALKSKLEALSELVAQRKDAPLSRLALERRAKGDEERLDAALQSEGYYGATLHTRIDFGATPIRVTLDIAPGPLYKIARFDVLYTEQRTVPDADLAQVVEKDGLAPGATARAADVLAAEGRVLASIKNAGYPLATISARKFVVDPATATMAVTLTLDAQSNAAGKWRFGATTFNGMERADPGYIKSKMTWEEGDPFDLTQLDEYRRALEGTGLFEFVRVEPLQEPPEGTDRLPVIVTVKERRPRTIGIGANYSTSEGPGAKIYWQHRNLDGRARRLNLTLTVATLRQGFAASYRRPEFLHPKQSFFTSAEVFHEDNDAYEQVGFDGSAGIERQIARHWSVSGASEFEVTRTDDGDTQTTSQLLTFPLIANYDTTDSYLDATKGVRARVRVAPSTGNNDGPVSFVTLEGTASTYFGVLKKPQTILALRGRLGLIAGEDTQAIPAGRRFYAGGGGSIRGYSYKNVGPRDADGTPTGGRSVAEVGVEARIRVTETFGVVPFVEGGNAYADSIDTFGEDFQWGGGIGFRYYSPIGPLRLDFAVPINRRDNIDDAFQIYVSIGQAF